MIEIPSVVNQICKKQIVDVFSKARTGQVDSTKLLDKLDEILQYVYSLGCEMGLTDSLNYVSNTQDRNEIFDALAKISEEIDNVQ